LADRSILREISAGLAHHPDRRTVQGFAPKGAKESVVHWWHSGNQRHGDARIRGTARNVGEI